jgi:RNA polymerase sigma-32 factor
VAERTKRRSTKSEPKPRGEAEAEAEARDDGESDGADGAGGDDDVLEAAGELVDDGDTSIELDEPKGLARYDALQAYMREVRRHPLLTPDEEHRLAVEYSKSGDVDVAARLVTANLRLVVKLAYEYRRAFKNMMDLVQEGNIGLMQAVKRYDPYRGVKLSSYAAWWIRAYMLRFILNNWRLVKIGTTQAQRKLFFNLSKEKAKLKALGIEPTSEEIAKRLNVAETDVVEMDRSTRRSRAATAARRRASSSCPARARRPISPRRARSSARCCMSSSKSSGRRSRARTCRSSRSASSRTSRSPCSSWATSSACRANACASSKRASRASCAST